jgi:hypothetical protein
MFPEKKIGPSRPYTIDRLVHKWSPLIKDLSEHEANVVAFVLEDEARFLNSLDDQTRAHQVGPTLRFVFPMLRRAAAALASDPTPTFTEVCESLEKAYEEILAVLVERPRSEPDTFDPTAEEMRCLIGALGERVHASLHKFQKVSKPS